MYAMECNPGYRRQSLVELDARRTWVDKSIDDGIIVDEWMESEQRKSKIWQGLT